MEQDKTKPPTASAAPVLPASDLLHSRYAVYWETFDNPRWQWQVFSTKDEALAFAKVLRRQGAWVYGVSKA